MRGPIRRWRPFLRVATTGLTGLAALLLLITSANVANLLMARAASRGREVALRAALGARRGRLVRQFLTEAVVLALLGSVVAVPIVVLAMRALRDLIARVSAIATFDPDLSVDVRVLGVRSPGDRRRDRLRTRTGVPGLSRRSQPLAEERRSRSAGGSGSRFRSALVVAQVALSLTLLVSGGLFVRSLDRARDVDLGFEPDGMLLASAAPGMQGYDPVQRLAFYRTVRDRIAPLPGVTQAAWISLPPLGIMCPRAEVSPDDRPPDPSGGPRGLHG